MDVKACLAAAIASGGADVHLQEGRVPLLRKGGTLRAMDFPAVAREDILRWLKTLGYYGLGGQALSFSFPWDEAIRCRAHVSREYAGIYAVVRMLYPLASLPPDGDEKLLHHLGELTQGLILFVGATGSGKTTALWRILSHLNATRSCHIITLEDPIEYVVPGDRALMTQRELHVHFDTYEEGIKQALRQDPDVLLVGEMRDRETMNAAITAAETGSLVFSTLHSPTAPQAISRLTGAFSGGGEAELRSRLAMVLQAVLAQRRLISGDRLVFAREILIATDAVRQLIRTGREFQLPSIMQTGAAQGMRTMKQALAGLGVRI